MRTLGNTLQREADEGTESTEQQGIRYELGQGRFCHHDNANSLCTHGSASVETIIENQATLAAIEQKFSDVEDYYWAGKQQVQPVWSNVGC